MMFAGHFPRMRFDLDLWQIMRVWEPENAGDWPGEGFYRFHMNDKPMVGYCAPYMSGKTSFAVRPVVRVKMGRA